MEYKFFKPPIKCSFRLVEPKPGTCDFPWKCEISGDGWLIGCGADDPAEAMRRLFNILMKHAWNGWAGNIRLGAADRTPPKEYAPFSPRLEEKPE